VITSGRLYITLRGVVPLNNYSKRERCIHSVAEINFRRKIVRIIKKDGEK
jgi:hypothetical protein